MSEINYSMHHRSQDCGVRGSVPTPTICAACHIAALEANLTEAKAGWDSAIADLREAAKICAEVEAQLAAITDLCRGYIDALDSGYDVLASHATDKIREAINLPQQRKP